MPKLLPEYKFENGKTVIPEGFRVLTSEERIESGDLFSSKRFESWRVQSGHDGRFVRSILEMIGENGICIRNIEDETLHKFKKGTQVTIDIGGKKVAGTITEYIESKPNVYGIKLDAGLRETIIRHEDYLTPYSPLMAGDYMITPTEKGIQVGCTFVSDDIIKKVAILRGLIKE